MPCRINVSKMGLKGNDGKATRNRLAQQFAAIFFIAVTVVAGLKMYGSAQWHSKALPREEHSGLKNNIQEELKDETNLSSGAVKADAVNKDIALPEKGNDESNFIQFEFSNLDGEGAPTGIVVVELHPEWAPLGVQRIKLLSGMALFFLLMPTKYRNMTGARCRFFRVVPNFIVQIGINGNPDVQKQWRSRHIEDDPVKMTNERGTVTFAMAGKGTRTSQIFFNTGQKNAFLDREGFAPFGKVISGMDVVDRIFNGYREKPQQGSIQQQGNSYLEKEFPKLSFISRAKFIVRT
ncbi:hypothetical protein HJC23_005292 [Cyclotella cryptica]|uniref:Peptidyl-prolyl cis-trans isomerase n=1 Tax=Cyclotella cryptica TaxID=29204 RepID=A0ABD3PFG7_9STRA